MTNELGEFSFGVFEGDWFFKASKAATWGGITLETVPSEGRRGIELAVASDALAQALGSELGITPNEAKGLVVLSFDSHRLPRWGPCVDERVTTRKGLELLTILPISNRHLSALSSALG